MNTPYTAFGYLSSEMGRFNLPGAVLASYGMDSWGGHQTKFLKICTHYLFAHGMARNFTRKEAVVIRAAYDDGEPMSYAAVKIYATDDKKFEHQNGRTDKNGCFALMPEVFLRRSGFS